MNNSNNKEIVEEIIIEEYTIEKIEEINKNIQKTNILLLLIFLAICVLIYLYIDSMSFESEMKKILIDLISN